MDPEQTLASALQELRQELGASSIVTDPDARDDGSHDRSRHHWQRAAAIIRCRSTAEVASAVAICARHGVPIVPRGAGTGLEGAANAAADTVVIDLSSMDRIVAIHDRDFDVVVEAGVMKSALNAALEPYGLWFPSGPGADASIGGMLSTRASGTQAVAYGTMRESALGLTVVLADGSVIATGSRARKSAAGYDLTHLLVGAEGTLGIITEATLRVHPVPQATAVLLCSFAELGPAGAAVYEVLRRGIAVSRVELLDAKTMNAINRYAGTSFQEDHTIIFEVAGSEAVVSEQLNLINAVVAEHDATQVRQACEPESIKRVWEARHQALPASQALVEGSSCWATDVCVPISELADSIVAAHRDIEEQGVIAPIVGHVGDGNFHLSIILPPGDSEALERSRRVNDALVRRAIAVGGTCSGEHGIGRGKREALRLQYGPSIEVMASIKRALDPDGILNPGAVFELE
jgi:D-lactate dehydrogenase (cytochrome)